MRSTEEKVLSEGEVLVEITKLNRKKHSNNWLFSDGRKPLMRHTNTCKELEDAKSPGLMLAIEIEEALERTSFVLEPRKCWVAFESYIKSKI